MNAVVLFCLLFLIESSENETLYAEENLVEEDKRTASKRNQKAAFLPDLILGPPGGSLFNPCPGHATGLAGEAFAELINTLVISTCILAAPCSYPHDMGGECQSRTVFDFIVIGGGTAGAVVASRLSEIADWNVLLLEAGGDPPLTTDVPYFYQNLQRTDTDWMYQTARENGLFNGYMGKVNRWPRGRMLGGTSSMGAMLYVRGNQRDFDNIAAAGNVGWAYSDVLPYFMKSEDMRSLNIIGSPILSNYHNMGGPLTVSRFGEQIPIVTLIQDAATDLGYTSNIDINAISSVGFTAPNCGTIRNGERMNTAKAFLSPVKERKNLFVIKHARVIKIHICPKTKRAYGVEYYYKNEIVSRTLRASREIIVCAGVIETPKLLMLSGIGPKNHLEEHKIFVVQNLRVGRNLQDTVCIPILPISIQFENGTKSPLDILDYSYQYLSRRSGMFATISATELIGMLNVDDDDNPDILIQFNYMTLNETNTIIDFVKNMGFEEDIVIQLSNILNNNDLIIPQVMLLHPKSTGTITLKSNDPTDPPLIRAGYLDHPKDLEDIMIGVRFIERLANHDFMRYYNSNMEYIDYPGCCGLDYGTDYYWACAMSHIAGTGHNQVGTCKMGPCEDPDAVVDSQLRVHGIKGLRVADASVLPSTLTGPTMATVIVIGEKVADMIKIQWLPDYKPWSTTRSPWSPPSTLMTPKMNKFRLPYQKAPPPGVITI